MILILIFILIIFLINTKRKTVGNINNIYNKYKKRSEYNIITSPNNIKYRHNKEIVIQTTPKIIYIKSIEPKDITINNDYIRRYIIHQENPNLLKCEIKFSNKLIINDKEIKKTFIILEFDILDLVPFDKIITNKEQELCKKCFQDINKFVKETDNMYYINKVYINPTTKYNKYYIKSYNKTHIHLLHK